MDTDQKKTFTFKFFNFLRKYSTKKLRNMHKTRYPDLKCPCCKEWFSISGLDYNHKSKKYTYENSEIVMSKCGKCEYKSFWNLDIAPFPVISDEYGIPLKTS